jgi:hypothetical protein
LAVWLSELKLDCRKCSDSDKVEKGCESDSPIPGVWKIGEQELQRCPIKVVTPQNLFYLRAYIHYIKGYFPNHGGWLDQPLKLIEALGIIEDEVGRMKDAREKEKKG